jgi:hypothetical protein
MTKEEQFVVKPLLKRLRKQKAQWEVHRPKYGTSATGWDIEARRKNLDMLIEAKYLVSVPGNGNKVFVKQRGRSWTLWHRKGDLLECDLLVFLYIT